jgi:hypothetical protein
MSKAEALDSLSDKAVAMMLAHIGISASDVERIEDIVSAYQTFAGLKADGWPGSNTMSDLWRRHRPTPAEIVEAATSALPWQTTYSQSNNLGMGESWFEEGPFKAGDCSDFASHCIGAPKKQVKAYGVLEPDWRNNQQWLAAAVIASGAIGEPRPWHTARLGDLVAFGGKSAHVEVVVADASLNKGGQIVLPTIGCSYSTFMDSKAKYGVGSAIAKRNRAKMWAKNNAVVVTPWWNERGEG